MEHFILGLLMVYQLTAYELHNLIKSNYQGICSHSIGNIQRALKKLHEKELVMMTEVRDGKVVKKVFSITPKGRAAFMKWLNNPIAITKAKNMEIGRLLLLGFLTKEQQLANIEIVIEDLKGEYEYMKAIETHVAEAGDTHQAVVDYLKEDHDYMEELLDAVETDDLFELVNNINKFGMMTLKHGIAQVQFNLEWFENLRAELVANE